MKLLKNSHLKDVNESYFMHLFYAVKYGIVLILLGLACILHGLIPNLFISTASDTMHSILKEINERKAKAKKTSDTNEYS